MSRACETCQGKLLFLALWDKFMKAKVHSMLLIKKNNELTQTLSLPHNIITLLISFLNVTLHLNISAGDTASPLIPGEAAGWSSTSSTAREKC